MCIFKSYHTDSTYMIMNILYSKTLKNIIADNFYKHLTLCSHYIEETSLKQESPSL